MFDFNQLSFRMNYEFDFCKNQNALNLGVLYLSKIRV